MTIRRAPVILSLLLSLGACDGHLVTLDIKEQQTAYERPHRHILYSCGENNVVDLVQSVARSLNLIEDSGSTEGVSQDRYRWRSPDGRFMLILGNQNNGLWRVELVDWPDPSRSELSIHAEAQIRQRLRTSCISS